ncbi:MAG: polysaccharide biosynthesis/export family protein [Thermodesulfobacteriota bacterium]|nr:polysaccharide biosynthesis/export family protein [Thermodesulfobacteriota bacterium]
MTRISRWIVLLSLGTCILSPSCWTGHCLAGAELPSYIVGPSDILNIYVWKEPELTRDITVMSDGRITFPLIGEIMAQGQNLTAIKERITDKLRDYLTAPEVTVILRESHSRRIYTLGKLNRPGPYPLEADMTVLQALSTAGGFVEWADTKNILIIRRTGKRERQLRFDYDGFISGKKVEDNIVLQPNDTIVVP